MNGDSVDPRAIAQIVRAALDEIHAASPLHDRVQSAQDALGQIKASLNPSDAFALAVELSKPLLDEGPNPLEPTKYGHVHFAFHVLEERVLLPDPWGSASGEFRESLRRFALVVMTAVGRRSSRSRFPPWVIQKAASLVAALAAREWPQQWPDFLDVLVKEALEHGTQDATCEVLRILSEDVHDFGDAIVSSRRQELSRAMSLTLDQTLSFVKNATEAYFRDSDAAGINACLRTLTAFLTWCNVEQAIDAGIPTACVGMLSRPIARHQALEALQGFFTRKPGGQQGTAFTRCTHLFRDVLFPAVLSYITHNSVPQRTVAESLLPVPANILPIITLTYDPPTFEEHRFQLNFVQMMAELGISYFALCFLPYVSVGKELDKGSHRAALTYAEFMLAAVAHPSLMIRLTALRFFSSFFLPPVRSSITENGQCSAASSTKTQLETHGSSEAANKTSTGWELLSAMSTGFIHAATLASIKRPSDHAVHSYEELDFDGDDDERQDSSVDFSSRIMTTVASATAVRPLESLAIALSRMQKLLLQLTSLSTKDLRESNCPWRNSLIVAVPGHPNSWEFGTFCDSEKLLLASSTDTVFAIAEATIAGGNASGVSSSDDTVGVLRNLFDTVVSISNSALYAQRVLAFRVFIPLFVKDADRLQHSLRLLLSQAAVPGPRTEARYRACQALASLCRRISKCNPGVLKDSRRPLCAFASEALGEDHLSCQEKGQLLEAAVTCIMTLDHVTEQGEWLETLLGPLLATVDVSADWIKLAFQSPQSLYQFLDGGNATLRNSFFTALYLLELTTHQVVREQSHSAVLRLPTPLSSSIAPRCVEICAQAIRAIHAMYNRIKFPLMEGSAHESALMPSSREIVSLLQLDGSSKLNGIEAPEMYGSDAPNLEFVDHCEDVLLRFELTPPSSEHRQVREALKILRSGAYELVRNSILSGVTRSPQHLVIVLDAISSDFQYLEPLHLYYLVNRVVRVLLSHTVVSADEAYLLNVSESGVPSIILLVNECLECLGASQIVASSNPTIDFAREHSRLKLCRAAADLLSGLFPKGTHSRRGDSSAGEAYLPPTLNPSTPVGSALWTLLRTMCGPDVARSEAGGSSRVVCNLVSSACEFAPESSALQYTELLVPCLQTAVLNHGRASDDSAVNAVVSITRRFWDSSQQALQRWIPGEGPDVQLWITAAFSSIHPEVAVEPNARRNSRATIRQLVARISQHAGLSTERSKVVRPLPTPLRAVNPVRSAARALDENSDALLADTALDSLFGGGEPI